MKETSLYPNHKALGAKIISFGGWLMPRDYGTGTISEVKACRSGVGLFDVSHMGEFAVTGPDALSFVQHLSTNDASPLTPGKAQYSLLLNESGGVIDDIIVYRRGPEDFLIVVNAGCKELDWDWFSLQARAFQVELVDLSDQTALIAVQGPQASSLVASLAGEDSTQLPRFHFKDAWIDGLRCVLSRTGYTGEDGFEIFCDWNCAPKVWNLLVDRGAMPCGLAARDVLRIEAAYPLYGHELSQSQIPLGVGLQWAIKTSKPDFIGRDSIILRAQDGLREKLVGLSLFDPANAIPRENQAVFANSVDEPVGRVTSGTLSPMLGHGIAMANIGLGFADPGTLLEIDIRGRRVKAKVQELPFYRGLKRKGSRAASTKVQ